MSCLSTNWSKKKQQKIESIALAVIKLADGIRRNNIITFAFILMILFAIDPGTETSSKLSFRCPFIHKVLSVLHSWFFLLFFRLRIEKIMIICITEEWSRKIDNCGLLLKEIPFQWRQTRMNYGDTRHEEDRYSLRATNSMKVNC